MHSRVVSGVALLVVLAFSGSSLAATTVTQNKSDFLGRTDSRDISGPIPNSGTQESVTIGRVTLTGAPASDCAGCGRLEIGPDWTNLLLGNEVAVSDVESFNVTVAKPTTALGFDFVEPTHEASDTSGFGCEAPCFDSTFTVTLKSGSAVVGTAKFNGRNDAATFIGISSDVPFDRAEIREDGGTNDNEYFGRFYGNLAKLLPPQLGKTANVRRVRGEVLVGIPSRQASAAQKGVNFVPLEEARSIPIGSFLDTTKGTVALTTARTAAGKTQSGRFSAGLFQVLQSRKRSAKGLTELRLKGSAAGFRRCGKNASASALSRRAIRRLRAAATGRYRTRGRHSAATVRGTTWTVEDRCDGTLTRVRRGRVAVRDFRLNKTIVLTGGKSYLARPASS